MLQQQGVLEVLVGDDGSTDGTVRWLSQQGVDYIARKNTKYSLNPTIYHPLIEKAKGDIIIFSGGEMACPMVDGVRRLAARCDTTTISQAAVYNHKKPSGGSAVADWVVDPDESTWRIRGHDDILYTGPTRPAPFMFFAAFPKELWERTGGYDRELAKASDVEFAHRAMRQGITFQGVGDVVAYHLTHPKR